MPKLRLGVIGAGAWAVAAHLPSLATRADDVEFVAVCRHGREALERVRRRFGFAVASEDYRDVLAAEPDIVVVASPPQVHAEHTIAALRAGAHVLCEKPFALHASEAWQMVRQAEESDRRLLVSFGWNYTPMVRRAAVLLAQHGIGDVEQLSIVMSSPIRELLTGTDGHPGASPETVPESSTWTDPSVSGGGYGQAQLSHALGLAFGLTGARCDGAFALTSRSPGRVELHDALSLSLDGGGIASVGGASSFHGADGNKYHLAVEAVGSEGQWHIDVFRERFALYRPGHGQLDLDVRPGDGGYDGSLAAQYLVDIALGRTAEPPAPGELGARTAEALELAYRSAASGRFEMRSQP